MRQMNFCYVARRWPVLWRKQLRIAAAFVPWLLLAPTVSAGVVTFDDLPAPTRHYQYVDLAPCADSGGFLFTSTNQNFESPQYYNIWGYFRPTAPWTGAVGQPAAVNGVTSGNQAACSMNYSIWQPSEYFVTRADGGRWTFGGAWFTAIWAGISNELRVVGYSGSNMVFDIRSMITIAGPTFIAPSVNGLEVDRIVITNQYTSQFGVAPGGAFAMDDLQYELVPAPGSLALLGFAGLPRSRRRR